MGLLLLLLHSPHSPSLTTAVQGPANSEMGQTPEKKRAADDSFDEEDSTASKRQRLVGIGMGCLCLCVH